MKLDADMYHFSTFDIPRNEGINKWAGGSVYKNTKNAIKVT